MNKLILFAICIFIIVNCDNREGINPCDKDYPENKPKLSLLSFEGNEGNYTIGYNVNQIGNDTEAIIGIALGTSPAPTRNENSIELGVPEIGDDSHQFEINALGAYYARIFIVNCLGTFYSNELSIQQSQENTISIESIEYIEDENNNGCINENEKLYYRLVVKNNSSKTIPNSKIVISSADAFVKNIVPDTLNISSILSQEKKFVAFDKTPTNKDFSFYIESSSIITNGNKLISFAIIENGIAFLQEMNITVNSPDFDISTSLMNTTNDDLIVEQGESLTFEVRITNNGNTSNNVILAPKDLSNGKIVSFTPPEINFGTINENSFSTKTFVVELASTIQEGTEIDFEYSITDDCDEEFAPQHHSFYVSSVSLNLGSCMIVEEENNDNFINVGEKVKIQVEVENLGQSAASNIDLTFKDSPFFSVLQGNSISILSIGSKATVDIELQVEESIPIGNFEFIPLASVGPVTFEGSCVLEIKDKDLPNLIIESYYVTNTSSGDNIINLGENVELNITIKNNGSLVAENVMLSYSMSSINGVNFASQDLGDIAQGTNASTSISFDVPLTISPGAHTMEVMLSTTNDLGFMSTLDLQIEDLLRPSFTVTPQLQNDIEANPCETVRYKLDIENTSSINASDVQFTLIDNQYISNITQPSNAIDINKASTQSLFIEFDINENGISGQVLTLDYNTDCTECTASEGSFEIVLGAPLQPNIEVEVNGINLQAGKMGQIDIVVKNIGGRDALNLNGTIDIDNPKVQLYMSSFAMGDIAVGSEMTASISAEVDESQINDADFTLDITLTDGKGYNGDFSSSLPVAGLITETEGLQTYITFDDEDLKDLIGGSTGFERGNLIYSDCTPQSKGKSLFFDGSSYFYFPNLNPASFNGPTSFNLWIKTYFTNKEPLITSNNNGELEIGDNKMHLGNGNSILPETFTNGQWHMLTFTYDGSDVNHYVDGIYNGTSVNAFVNWAISGTVNFGYFDMTSFSGQRKHFDGYMDDIRIYNKALNQSSITNIYNSEKPESDIEYNIAESDNLVLLYDFNDNNLGVNSMNNWESNWNAINYQVEQSSETPSGNGLAAIFDGSGYLNNSKAILSQMYNGSFSFWVKADLLENNTILKGTATSSNNLYIKTGGSFDLEDLKYGNTTFSDKNSFIFDNTWKHIVITSGNFFFGGNGNHNIYINGEYYGTSTDANDFIPNDSEFNIGIKPFSTANDFIGSLDNFRIYTKELSKSEVQAIYDAEK